VFRPCFQRLRVSLLNYVRKEHSREGSSQPKRYFFERLHDSKLGRRDILRFLLLSGMGHKL
jgi:hypothetical protein